MARDGDPVRRVCLYARQQCGVEEGCLTFDALPWGVAAARVERSARLCPAAGASLYAGEVLTGIFRVEDGDDEKRALYRGRRFTQVDNAVKQIEEREAAERAGGAFVPWNEQQEVR